MRLIQPTLLFLGMAIYCATASPPGGASSGASNVNPQQQLTNCITTRCGQKFGPCYGNDKCRTTLFCKFGCGSDARKCINCGENQDSEDVLQCAADQKCFQLNNTCPSESQIDKTNPDNPNLVEQLANKKWHGVLSLSKIPDDFLRFPCLRTEYSGTGKNATISVEFCMGNIATGQCNTSYVQLNGQGSQEGNRGILKFNLDSGFHVVKPTDLTVHVHYLDKDEFEFVLVSVCKHDPIQQFWSQPVLFSTSNTLEKLLANSKDSNKTEKTIRDAIAKQGGDYDNAYKINGASCQF